MNVIYGLAPLVLPLAWWGWRIFKANEAGRARGWWR